MGNMSYCRWENTASDMADCVYAQEDGFDPETASASEKRGYLNALEKAAELLRNAADYGHLQPDGPFDVGGLIEALQEVNDG